MAATCSSSAVACSSAVRRGPTRPRSRRSAGSLGPFGYTVVATEVRGCLHLKSAVTALDDARLLVNPEWIDAAAFDGFTLVEVAPDEPEAANVLRLGDRVVAAAAFPRTAARLEALGVRVERVDASELAKAEGAITCCSLIVVPKGSEFKVGV